MIFGKVQGVNFRFETKFIAKNLSLTGWVKNLPDATVEIIAEGNEEKLKELIRWCTRGPQHAMVNKVETNWQEYKEEFTEFKIIN